MTLRRLHPAALCSSLVLLAGNLPACTSVTSRYVGTPRDGQSTGGFPIVVQRPRYLKVTYKMVTRGVVVSQAVAAPRDPADPARSGETTPTRLDLGTTPPAPGAASGGDLIRTPGSAVAVTSTSIQRLDPVEEVETETVTVGETFCVDFKRPAAGTAEYGMEFESGQQYPKAMHGKVEDKTITEAASAIGDILDKVMKGLKPTAGQAPSATAQTVVLNSEIIRIEYYDLLHLDGAAIRVITPTHTVNTPNNTRTPPSTKP
jgi:hypothetical protein